MNFSLDDPKEIYKIIDGEIYNIINRLSVQEDDEAIKNGKDNAVVILKHFQCSLSEKLAELEKYSEWKIFTIAFYGETGAGKSTIVETLRILLKERSKLASQEKFREIRKQYEVCHEKLKKLEHVISDFDLKINEMNEKLLAAQNFYEEPYKDVQQAIEQAESNHNAQMQLLTADIKDSEQRYNETLLLITQIKTVVSERKKNSSLWQKLLNIVRKLPEEIELNNAMEKLKADECLCNSVRYKIISEQENACKIRINLERKKDNIVKERDIKCGQIEIRKKEAEKNKAEFIRQRNGIAIQIDEILAKLQQYSDGEIIGDGRPDFTRECHRYEFELNGQSFALLDVPGIEGKEDSVLDQIKQAVQTAHAVFYVTNRPTPPQTGDADRPGTLEKIKEHLGSQTEVWTIFNKKIVNPRYLINGRPFISDDEKASLDGLDEKMREQLGSHYREVFSLAALPAFLASTDHFSPQSQNAKRRSKLLEDFTVDDLIEWTRVRAFMEFLGSDLTQDVKTKITRANFNKAKEAIDQAGAALADIQLEFYEVAENLNKDAEKAKAQIDTSFQAVKSRLESCGEKLIENFARVIRNNMYDRIESGISNDVFKDAIYNQFENQHKNLGEELPKAFKYETEKFQKNIEDILFRYEKHANDISSQYEKIGKTGFGDKFDVSIKFDNGVKVSGLLAGIFGLAIAPFTGGASLWVTGAAILTSIASIAKAAWSLVSSSYKKSQQRKVTDENIREVTAQLRKSLNENINIALPKIQNTIIQIKEAIDSKPREAYSLLESINISNERLKIISSQIIKNTGNL